MGFMGERVVTLTQTEAFTGLSVGLDAATSTAGASPASYASLSVLRANVQPWDVSRGWAMTGRTAGAGLGVAAPPGQQRQRQRGGDGRHAKDCEDISDLHTFSPVSGAFEWFSPDRGG